MPSPSTRVSYQEVILWNLTPFLITTNNIASPPSLVTTSNFSL